jgi:hypothetical protein
LVKISPPRDYDEQKVEIELRVMNEQLPLRGAQTAANSSMLGTLVPTNCNCGLNSAFRAGTPKKMRYEAVTMTNRKRIPQVIAECVTLGLLATACGASVVRSGVGVGAVGRGLSVHAATAPQGAQVCLLQDSLGPRPVGLEKSMGDTCSKALKSDALWRRAVLVMSLYGQRLESVASGADVETSGRLEAALTGITSTDWSDADDSAARDAVTTLVNQMSPAAESKVDLSKIIQDAAPPIKTLCDGLTSYLDSQSQSLAAIQKDVDKKRMSRTIRRCGMLEKQTVCVADTVVDHMVYAEVFGEVVALENSTLEARDSVTRFCVAHEKLAAAAANGQLTKKQTYFDVVEAVKAVPRAQSQSGSSDSAKPADAAKPATAPAKPAEPAKK